MLLLVLLIAITCGWVTNRMERKRREEAAIKSVSGTASFSWDYKQVPFGSNGHTSVPALPTWLWNLVGRDFLNEVVGISFRENASDDDLKALIAFDRVRVLWTHPSMGGCGSPLPEPTRCPVAEITDEGLRHIGRLASLEELHIDCKRVTAAGLRHLSGLTHLKTLYLSCSPLTATALDALGAMHQLEKLAIHVEGPNGNVCRLSDTDLEKLRELTGLKELHIDFADITDAGLAHIGRMTQLEKLTLSSKKMTDSGLKNLRMLTRVRELSLSCALISDEGLVNIAQMRDLESLNIYGTQITGAGFANAGALPRLRYLWFGENIVSASGFGAIENLRELEDLSLSGPEINDEALAHIGSLPKLKNLDVQGTEITDGGLRCLSGLTELRRARFASNVRLTDAAMEHIKGCKELTYLSIDGWEVTGKGVIYLQDLPKLMSWFSGNWNFERWVLANRGLTTRRVRPLRRGLAEGAHCRPSALPG